MNDFDFRTFDTDRFALEWLGNGYGVVYIDNCGAVYFDWAPVFTDGFESGNEAVWSASTP